MIARIQDNFWSEDYAFDYARKNSVFNNELGSEGWSLMLSKASLTLKTYLEVGCNIGRNIDQLARFDADLKGSAVEISRPALDYVCSRHDLLHACCAPVQDANLPSNAFELVFTCGVLIHIPPKDLLLVMGKMYEWSAKYVLIGEYFNRTPVALDYQGRQDMLFKRDFGKLFIESFPVKLVDYGFLWGKIYDDAGFDDITWWLFEKTFP
jgi:pseudaminic acid biosynthesis-associated methylase